VLAKPIHSITPFTLLDYPNKSACILWYAGCNMRCLYCYNPEIVLGKGAITFFETISFLKTRQGLLDAVVFSGGECLMHKKIVQQIQEIKAMGFLVKIDTNGSNPKVLEQLIDENLIDYVALDFKATKEKFQEITKSDLFQPFEKSFEILLENTIQFEIRTTYHSDLISNIEMREMVSYLDAKKYTGNYYIQSFRNHVATLAALSASARIKEKALASALHFNIVFRNGS
jgi:pyruvate formate lyase activating enzyme